MGDILTSLKQYDITTKSNITDDIEELWFAQDQTCTVWCTSSLKTVLFWFWVDYIFTLLDFCVQPVKTIIVTMDVESLASHKTRFNPSFHFKCLYQVRNMIFMVYILYYQLVLFDIALSELWLWVGWFFKLFLLSK